MIQKMAMLNVLVVLLSAGCTAAPSSDVPGKGVMRDGVYNVKDFGAKADGKSDDTAVIQKAIDKAAVKGGTVLLPAGFYLVKGGIKVKPGVAVTGSLVSPIYPVPDYNDKELLKSEVTKLPKGTPAYFGAMKGTVVLAVGGRDKEDAPPLFELSGSGTIKGLSIYYPDQKWDDIHPYPWSIQISIGDDNTVQDVVLVNSYNGIRVGPQGNARHNIRNVIGCVLKRGIYVDWCVDIGRIENVHWHSAFWALPEINGNNEGVFKYMVENLEAFVFARTDWEYVTNCFVFPAHIGYRFIESEKGSPNGQLSGCAADATHIAVQVDSIQHMGLLITNGQFVSFYGVNPAGLIVNEKVRGQVRMVNCNYWGAFENIATIKSDDVYVGFSDCYFSNWGIKKADAAAIHAEKGRLQVNNCTFNDDSPSIHVGKDVKHAVLKGNNGPAASKITDMSGKAVIGDNE